MSNHDISRFLFQPGKHYTEAGFQQGRVQLDSDFNEGAAHRAEDHRRTLLELIGAQGTPDNTGFSIGTVGVTDTASGNPTLVPIVPGTTAIDYVEVKFNDAAAVRVPAYYIGPGAMYVGGLRVELEQTEFIAFQRDYLQINANQLPSMYAEGASSASSGSFIHCFYLHVWEQWVSAVEDDEFLEHALGGPDTSVRVRRMRRVEFAHGEAGETCSEALGRILSDRFNQLATFDALTGELRSHALLRIDFDRGLTEDTCAPCDPSTTGRYLGAENQAIRIMLTSASTYVWGIDDAAPLYRASLSGIESTASVVTVKLDSLPKDEEHWPIAGRVVQILPWSAVLPNGEMVADEVGVSDGMGVFCKVLGSYQPEDATFTIDTSVADSSGQTVAARLAALISVWDEKHPEALSEHLPSTPQNPRKFYVRFWHQSEEGVPAEIPTYYNSALGKTGLVPNFLNTNGVPGDYWIATVRPETPSVIIPLDLMHEGGVPPHGPRNFYAPLAIVTGTTDSSGNELAVDAFHDCRHPMFPVTDGGCCTLTVGDGVQSRGQYSTIQAAIDALPESGGLICVRPGLYVEEIELAHRSNVTIAGCGPLTVIQGPPTPTAEAVVTVMSGANFRLESLTIRAAGQMGLDVYSVTSPRFSNIRVEAMTPESADAPDDDPLVYIHSCGDVDIDGFDILAGRRTGIHLSSLGDLQAAYHVQSYVRSRCGRITVRSLPRQFTDQEPPTGPLAIVESCHVLLEDWVLMAYGRVALEAKSVWIVIRNFSITSLPFSPQHMAKSALDVWSANFLIEQSAFQMRSYAASSLETISKVLSEHAAVVLQGEGVFRNNDVSVDADVSASSGYSSSLVWGGVQLRSGFFSLQRNRIDGGAGHGITLGSVYWYQSNTDPTDPDNKAFRREGAGKTQMLPDGKVTGSLRNGFWAEDGAFYVPIPETGMGKIEILDNTIEHMGTSGISVLTLLGLPTDAPLFIIDGPCRISNNRIRNNLGNVYVSEEGSPAEPLLPVGGSRNGTVGSQNAPIAQLQLGGIVLAGSDGSSGSPEYGTAMPLDLVIQGNVIEDNGGNAGAREVAVCGIFVLAAPSVAITDNVVVRNGMAFQSGDALKVGQRAGIAVMLAGVGIGTRGDVETVLSPNWVQPARHRSSLRVSGNRVEHPEGRALFAVGTGSMTIENNHFASLGFHGSVISPEGLADRFAIGDVVYVHNLGRPWESIDSALPLPDENETKSGSRTKAFVNDQLGTYEPGTDLFFVGVGGHTLFNCNQVVYDWTVQEQFDSEPLTYAPVALVSMDYLGVRGNNFAFRLDTSGLEEEPTPPIEGSEGAYYGGRPVLTHLLAVSYAVDVSHNRVSEGFHSCEVSIMTLGYVVNSVMGNIGTHCSIGYTVNYQAGHLQILNNVSLMYPTESGCSRTPGPLWDVAQDFFALLYDLR